jgi:hypothetical protein
MKFVVRSCYLVNTHEEQISLEQFHRIKHSRGVLNAALEAEQIFDTLISNYLEVENRCISLTTTGLVRQVTGYREANEALASINLTFVNYLSTARAYVDKIGSATKACLSGLEAKAARVAVERLKSEQYDADFGYRFMEALRNHVQHSGSALHILSPDCLRSSSNDELDVVRELFLSPLCMKNRLIECGDFKSKVLKECPESVNLLECLRVHLRGLTTIQKGARFLVERATLDAANCIKEAQRMLTGKVAGSLDATEAVAVEASGHLKERVPMLLHWDEVRLWLAQRNKGLTEGSQDFPSGRISPTR